MEKDIKILEEYKKIAKFMSCCYGENVEVILHDLIDINESGVEIYNGHISGRKKGAPISELGMKILKEKIYEKQDFISNSKGLVGGKVLRSSTYFIKNEIGKIIGLICVNINITKYLELAHEIEKFVNFDLKTKGDESLEIKADFPHSVKSMINTALIELLKGKESWKDMKMDEKLNIIKKLQKKGIFDLRGGVLEVSEALNISEPTIYRYLTKID
ncbi:PAS domain-containing protein [uncultured Cetobacterium sp.]|uniref:helix-turn-helix transcriptional regulator n=1 Tax=uncultured Cetobacterium sp. TaxID=527638 RepID=UPI00262A7713|nr:PAS domain-containing protein [uncultured Cetobacterium sp.]